MTITTIEVGQQAPNITLQDDKGNDVSLRKLRGKTVVLYFYPKDDTSGCTKQACSLRDNWDVFKKHKNIVLYGVSRDSAERHQKFRDKYSLPFPLLVDDEHELADAFGIWKEKMNYGKTYMGIERSTVIIDPEGNVEALWRRVKPLEHTDRLRKHLNI